MTDSAPGPHKSGSVGKYRLRGETNSTYDPARTVLLVIDPVNDFLSEGGAGWDMTKGTVKKNDVVENLKRVIAGARERAVPVVFGPMAYTEEDYADQELQRRSGINRLMFERKMFQAGSWGADFHPDLQPAEDEVVLLPHKGIDVFETDLPQHLERLNTTHLVIAGMTASLCCESTGRHAMEHGYDVTFVKDAIGADSLPSYEAAVHLSYPLIANAVVTVDDFLAAVQSAGDPVQQGDTVLGSDHGEIGTVEKVVAPSDSTDGYLVVPRGLIFEKDTFIPLDAVVKRAGTKVFINIPKLIVGKMPWEAPPSRQDRTTKLGPPAQQVDRLYGSRSPSSSTSA
ncbi:MAG: cysteine hydrolase [Actinomycetota bacterium]|nr:cysteine hydrolase [Actinomycetota bacterium]